MSAIRKKIIYVDDVNFSLLSVKDRLKNRYEVYTAISATKLFETLARITPDLILLDVNMPHVDGYETIMQLKADPRYADIPVVFLTGQNDRDSVFKGLNLGAAAYVFKPFSTEHLVAQIEKVFVQGHTAMSAFKDLVQTDVDCNRPIILAIDDVAIMLRTLHAALRDLYNVYTLTKPDELRSFLRSVRPDLFLLDCNMPVYSGFDLVPQIREFPEHEQTPIIFVTSDATIVTMSMAAGLGACDFIIKPVNRDVLREKIARHIRRGAATAL